MTSLDMIRILVCGDRDWMDEEGIWRVLDKYLEQYEPDQLLIIQGDARGADMIAKEWAERNQIDHMSFPARWRVWGRRAGPIRNRRMLMEGEPDIVHAFHDNFANSTGTKHMVEIARRAGVEVKKHKHKRRA